MNTEQQAIRDQQKDSWNKFSGGWKKWNAETMRFLKPMGDKIIEALHIKPSDVVLDIASGTGEPAFTIAKLVTGGEVYATDVSDKMLQIARDYADEHELENMEFKVADISELPFEDRFFNKISCRMGFMFFPDMQLAAQEMFRVCKSEGRVATSVWAAPDGNDWVTTIMKILSASLQMPPPPAGAPGMFRCAKQGMIKAFFEQAGFINVQEEIIHGTTEYASANQYWENMNEVAAPVVGALSKADEATKAKIKDEVFAACNSKAANGKLVFNFASTIISGEKP